MIRWIVILVFGGFGLTLFCIGVRQFFLQRRLLKFSQPIEAVITHASVSSHTSANTDRRLGRNTSTTTHRPDLRFRYELEGQTYESDLLRPNIIVTTYGSPGTAAEELRPFPVGKTVRAFVDPAYPAKAFLIAEPTAGPVVFIIVGLLVPPVVWFVSRYI